MTIAALDAPLPAELIGREHGWFTRYRRWPVFSPCWARGRLSRMALILGCVFAPLLLTTLALDDPADRPWPGLAEVALTLLLPTLIGPALGVRVRRRRWSERVEGWALVAVVAACIAAGQAFSAWGAEPMKQFIAERTGNVDAQGQRRRIVMQIGMTIRTPDDEAGGEKPEARDDALTQAFNAAFRAGVTFLLAGGLALRGWRREREGLAALAREHALAEAQAQRREAELKLSVLAAQVEPHFLFNTLAGVRSAIATDPARAAEMIDRLVEYLRAAIPRLRRDGSAQATVGAQFEIVRAYLGLMTARMPRLAWSVTADDDALLAMRCPPLMLISLVENAVKHGVEPKIGPVRVDVRAERRDGHLALVVDDDGAGFGASTAGTGLGLTNIRERLAQLHGERASLSLKARPGGGVSATITVPLEPAHEEDTR